MDISKDISVLVDEFIHVPRSCAFKQMQARHDREQLKMRILQMFDNYRNFIQNSENENRKLGTEKDTETTTAY